MSVAVLIPSAAFRLALLYSLCFCPHITHQFAQNSSTVTASQPQLSQLRSAFDEQRLSVRNEEQQLRIGGGSQLRLSAAERALDAHLLRLKRSEFEAGLADPDAYAPAMHFFAARPLIERSAVFALLRRMPKAGLLHAHSSAMVSAAWFVQNLTYRSDMLRCTTAGGDLRLTFRRADWHKCAADSYRSVTAERAAAADRQAYDAELERALSMDIGEGAYATGHAAWRRFDGLFGTVSDVMAYEHTFRLVFRRLLQELYDDGVMYVELRTGFKEIYYDDNRAVTASDVIHEFLAILTDFCRTHPTFFGVKFIYSKQRLTDNVENLLAKYRALKAEFPDLIVGFDLVGQEDVGKPLYKFVDQLLTNSDVNYLFHAGETDRQGDGTDDNMLDAILLNTTRIGHGYSLYKHPVLLDYVRRRQICLEICPISNQVLGLVADLRNHPATVYSARNVPMVIASDDPGFWGATGLSYDLYYALMAFTGVDTGLTYVKQLLLNSLKYSMLSDEERQRANAMFERQWQRFVEEAIETEMFSVTTVYREGGNVDTCNQTNNQFHAITVTAAAMRTLSRDVFMTFEKTWIIINNSCFFIGKHIILNSIIFKVRMHTDLLLKNV